MTSRWKLKYGYSLPRWNLQYAVPLTASTIKGAARKIEHLFHPEHTDERHVQLVEIKAKGEHVIVGEWLPYEETWRGLPEDVVLTKKPARRRQASAPRAERDQSINP